MAASCIINETEHSSQDVFVPTDFFESKTESSFLADD